MRLAQLGFELQSALGFAATNASSGPVVTFPTPGRSGIDDTRYRRMTPNGFGGGQSAVVLSFDPSPEIYGQFAIRLNGGSSGPEYGFQIRDGSGNNIFRLRTTAGVAGTLSTLIGTSTADDDATATLLTSWLLIEFYLLIDDTVGEIIVKFDGVDVYSFTGNTDPNSRVNATDIRIMGGGFQTVFDLDDVIINDVSGSFQNSWVNNETLLLLRPSGDGDSSDMTGSDGNSTDNYLLVDETPHDGDSTYVAATTTGLKDLYALADLPTLPAGSAIRTVQPLVIARRADPSTPSNVDVGIKSDSTEDFAAPQALNTTYGLLRGTMYYEDPHDNTAWDEAKVNALQAGIESS